MSRQVLCSKFKKEMPGLEKPPFKGEMGEKLYENVSSQAWEEWKEMQIKVLNEYRLDMSNPQHYDQLIETMLGFLGLADTAVPEVENADRGSGE